jgi:hypothetical protein
MKKSIVLFPPLECNNRTVGTLVGDKEEIKPNTTSAGTHEDFPTIKYSINPIARNEKI